MNPAQEPTPRSTESKAQPLCQQMDELLEMVAHDLNSPLTTILMASDLIRMEFAPSDARLEDLTRDIHASADRMRRMISKYLMVKELIQGSLHLEPAPVPLLSLVTTVLRRFSSPAAQRQIILELNSSAKDDEAFADHDAIEQVLDSLIWQSLKRTPGEGTLRVDLSETPEAVVIEITDGGPLPTEEDVAEFTLRRNREQSIHSKRFSLGIFAAGDIAEQSGGKLELHPGSETGSKFRLFLPKVPKAA